MDPKVECLSHAYLICQGFTTKVTEDVVICFCKECRVRWMAESLIGSRRTRYMRPEIVMKKKYSLVINQYWLLLLQFLLHIFQLMPVMIWVVGSSSYCNTAQLVDQKQTMILRGCRGGLVVWGTWSRGDNQFTWKCHRGPIFRYLWNYGYVVLPRR